jgi:hypothetical protein
VGSSLTTTGADHRNVGRGRHEDGGGAVLTNDERGPMYDRIRRLFCRHEWSELPGPTRFAEFCRSCGKVRQPAPR